MKESWRVKISLDAETAWKGDALTEDDRIVIQLWTKTVRDFGPEELKRHPGQWNDHALHGHWAGCRASNFSNSGRVIYYRFDEHRIVEVLRITASHDYSKEGKP